MRRSAFFAALLLTGPLFAAPPVAADSPNDALGRWDREDGLGGIDITRCGDALCGRIVWLRDQGTPAHVGQTVLYDMRPSAPGTWSGSANNPEDGRTYAGSMTVDGRRLLTRGCLFGGMICKSVALARPAAR